MTKRSRSKRRKASRASNRSKSHEQLSPSFDGLDPALQTAYAEFCTSDPRFKIVYLIPHHPQDLRQASLFGWYTPGLHDAAGPLRLGSVLPADIREPFTGIDYVLMNRQTRRIWPMVVPIQLDAISEGARYLQSPFQVYFTNDEKVAVQLDLLLASLPYPALHFSTASGVARLPYSEANVARICLHVRNVLAHLAAEPEWKDFVRQARSAIANTSMRRPTKHPLPMGFHNVVAPNELALSAFGRRLIASKRISQPGLRPPKDPAVYVTRICDSADAVAEERKRILAGALVVDHRVILATATAYWGIFERWREIVRAAPKEHRKSMEIALSAVIQGTTYYDSIPLDKHGNPPMNPAYLMLTEMRVKDLATFTSALILLSTKSLIPVLRLEPKIHQVRGQIKQLASCVRAEARHHFHWKVSRLLRSLGMQMRGLIDDRFLERIDAPEAEGRIEGIKLVSDVPLELLPTGGISLGLRFDVSRLSPIPGNQFIQQCMSGPVMVPLSSFQEILVIRSFKATDRLRNVFQTAVDSVRTSEPDQRLKIKYRFVDVQSSDEFVAALAGYSGAILIFDGHGKYDTEFGVGSLVLGDEILDAWSLRERCVVPPIVMFSACDTHPIDGSHGSVAMAAFNLGAKAVLGTTLPINGVTAAIFNARLALRIEQFMPIALKAVHPSPLTWRAVVSGMLRMSHTVEILTQLSAPRLMGLDGKQVSHVQLMVNTAINLQQANWYTSFEEELANCTGRSTKSVREVIEQHVGFTDAMKYVHLGNPENIIIVNESVSEVFDRFGFFASSTSTHNQQ